MSLLFALQIGDQEGVRKYIEGGGDLEVELTNNGSPPITIATTIPCLQLLLDAHVDLNHPTRFNGNTALHWAAEGEGWSHTKIKMLLKAGADPTIQNHQGKTPRDLAETEAIREIFDKHKARHEKAILKESVTAIAGENLPSRPQKRMG